MTNPKERLRYSGEMYIEQWCDGNGNLGPCSCDNGPQGKGHWRLARTVKLDDVLEAARKQWDEETPAQWQDCTECAERAKRVEKERDEVRKRLEQQTDWYQQRFNRLRKWVKEEVEPLSKEVAHRYFSICANGSPAPHESADWTDTMHGLKLRAEQAEKQLDETLFKCEQAELGLANGEEELAEVRQERDELRDRLEAITHEFECTIEYADTRGTGGVSLPFYGDFAPVVQLPSVISRMRRWAKILREVLEKTK